MGKKLGGTFHPLHLHMSGYFNYFSEPLKHFTHSVNIFQFIFLNLMTTLVLLRV